MIYYPKSKIQENLHTNGNEFLIKRTNQPFIGYYYALSNNKFFTGKNPEDPNTEEIIQIPQNKPNVNITLINDINKKITNSGFILPNPFYPNPTEKDYQLGFLTRYFMKKRNANFTTIIEISPDDFNKNFSNPTDNLDINLYIGTKINWKITGPLHDDFSDKNFPKAGIIETNQKLVKLKEPLFPGISLFITDYTQFARVS